MQEKDGEKVTIDDCLPNKDKWIEVLCAKFKEPVKFYYTRQVGFYYDFFMCSRDHECEVKCYRFQKTEPGDIDV